MNKLETITQLLVNELADFEKNVQQLGDQMERAESLRVKFDVTPIKGLISQLEEFAKRETERREHYLNRLECNLQQAKIYPKWAVITFMVSWTFALGAIFYMYLQASNLEQNKRDAYQLGIQENEQFLNKFFDDNPKIRKEYEKWMKKNKFK